LRHQLGLKEVPAPWPADQYDHTAYVVVPAHVLAASASATTSTEANASIRRFTGISFLTLDDERCPPLPTEGFPCQLSQRDMLPL
jgi:hypothetical protein